MKLRILSSCFFMILVLQGVGLCPAISQEEHHGADSSYRLGNLVILWGMVKGPDEDRSWVAIKMIRTGSDPGPWESYRVEAVDPFSQEKEWVTPRESLGRENLIQSPRSSFRDKTGRRIFLYPGPSKDEKPSAVIFYQGVPDTTPEFLTEKEMEDYFAHALKRMKP
jgi:hypothetical protein